MQQKQLVQDRLKRLEKINDSVNKVRRKISGRVNLSEQENIKKIESILFDTTSSSLKSSLKILEHNIIYQRVESPQSKKDLNQSSRYDSETKINSLPDLAKKNKQSKSFGCIVSSKNGIFKKTICKQLDSADLLDLSGKKFLDSDKKFPTDVFQTVRSVNIGSSQQVSIQRDGSFKEDKLQPQEILFQQEVDIQKIVPNQHILEQNRKFYESIQDVVQDCQQSLIQDDYLLNEKQQLEKDIAKLDTQLGKFKIPKKVAPQVKRQETWCQDRENFENQWLQLEGTQNEDTIQWQTLDQDLFDMLAEAETTQQIDPTPQIDRQIIDSLAKEVEELMVMNNLYFNDQQQQHFLKKSYNPPLEIIEEEVSMEISFLN